MRPTPSEDSDQLTKLTCCFDLLILIFIKNKFNALTGITWIGEWIPVSLEMQEFLTAMPKLYSERILVTTKYKGQSDS